MLSIPAATAPGPPLRPGITSRGRSCLAEVAPEKKSRFPHELSPALSRVTDSAFSSCQMTHQENYGLARLLFQRQRPCQVGVDSVASVFYTFMWISTKNWPFPSNWVRSSEGGGSSESFEGWGVGVGDLRTQSNSQLGRPQGGEEFEL